MRYLIMCVLIFGGLNILAQPGPSTQAASRFKVETLSGNPFSALTSIPAGDVDFTLTDGLVSGSDWGFKITVDPDDPRPFPLGYHLPCGGGAKQLTVWVYRNGTQIARQTLSIGAGPIGTPIPVQSQNVLLPGSGPIDGSRYSVVLGWYDDVSYCIDPSELGHTPVQGLIWTLNEGPGSDNRTWNQLIPFFDKDPTTLITSGNIPPAFTFYYDSRPLGPQFNDSDSEWRDWQSDLWATNHGSVIVLPGPDFESVSWTLRHLTSGAEISHTHSQPDADSNWLYTIPDPAQTMGVTATDGFRLEAEVKNAYGISGTVTRDIGSLRALAPQHLRWDIDYSLNAACADRGLIANRDLSSLYQSSYQAPINCNDAHTVTYTLTGIGNDLQNLEAPQSADYTLKAGMLFAEYAGSNCLPFQDKAFYPTPLSTTPFSFSFNSQSTKHMWRIKSSTYTDGFNDDFVEFGVTTITDERSGKQWLPFAPRLSVDASQWMNLGQPESLVPYRLRLTRIFGYQCTPSTASFHHTNLPDSPETSFFTYDGSPLSLYFRLFFDAQSYPNTTINHLQLLFYDDQGEELPTPFGVSIDTHGVDCPDPLSSSIGNNAATYAITLPADMAVDNGTTIGIELRVDDGASPNDCGNPIPVTGAEMIATANVEINIPDPTRILDAVTVNPTTGPYLVFPVDSGEGQAAGSINFAFDIQNQGETPSGIEWYWQRDDGMVWDPATDTWITLVGDAPFAAVGGSGFNQRWAYNPAISSAITPTDSPPPFLDQATVDRLFGDDPSVTVDIHARLAYGENAYSNIATLSALTIAKVDIFSSLSLLVSDGGAALIEQTPLLGDVNFEFQATFAGTPDSLHWRWKRADTGAFWDEAAGDWTGGGAFQQVDTGSGFSSRWQFDPGSGLLSTQSAPFPSAAQIANFFDGQTQMGVVVEAQLLFGSDFSDTVGLSFQIHNTPPPNSNISALRASIDGVGFYANHLNLKAADVTNLVFRVTTGDTTDLSANLHFEFTGPASPLTCKSLSSYFDVTPNLGFKYYEFTPKNFMRNQISGHTGIHTIKVFPSSGCTNPLIINLAVNSGPSFTIRYHYRDHLGSSSVSRGYTTDPSTPDQLPAVMLNTLAGQDPGRLALFQRNLETTTYQPFGAPLSPDSTATDRSRYTDHERDQTSGLNYMKGRFQIASLGKFNRPDPMRDWDWENPHTINLYQYVRNNPINIMDKDGYTVPSYLAKRLVKWAVKKGKRLKKPDDVRREFNKRGRDVVTSKTQAKKLSRQKGRNTKKLSDGTKKSNRKVETHEDETGRGKGHTHKAGRKLDNGRKSGHAFVNTGKGNMLGIAAVPTTEIVEEVVSAVNPAEDLLLIYQMADGSARLITGTMGASGELVDAAAAEAAEEVEPFVKRLKESVKRFFKNLFDFGDDNEEPAE